MRILVLSLCVTMLAALLPAPLHALDLTERDNGKSITLSLGQPLSITLPGNPTTGYTWEPAALDRGMMAMEPGPSFVPDSALAGAGGTFTFRLVPRQSGKTSLRLVYHRPWEKDVQPLRAFEVIITVAAAGKGENHAVYRSSAGEYLSAVFDLNRNVVTVSLPDGRSVTLPVAVSASGARYGNGTETFWEHQGTGRFFRGEKLVFEGMILNSEEDQTDSCRECK